MKKVFLYAYNGVNLGDDLFVHAICRRYPQVQFYIRGGEERRRVLHELPNLKVLSEDTALIRRLHALRPSLAARYLGWQEARCDAVVYIGGSIFIEYENWEQILTWWEYEAENRPFYVLGANFGPYASEGYRQASGRIFAKMRDICFRDLYSYDLFREYDSVRYAPDILLSYPMPDIAVKEKQLFVSLIDCASKDEGNNSLAQFDESYVANMAHVLKAYVDDGFSLVLGSFCQREGDEVAIQKVLHAMDADKTDGRISVLCYDGTNACELTRSIAQSEYVIASRFHAAILALAAGRPVFPVIYSDKTSHVLRDMKFRGVWADLRDGQELSYEASRKNLDEKAALIDGDLRREAKLHFKKLDEVLS